LGCSEFESGEDVFGFEIGVVLEDLVFGDAGRQEFENVFNSDPHAANAGAAAALIGIDRNAVEVAHCGRIVRDRKALFQVD